MDKNLNIRNIASNLRKSENSILDNFFRKQFLKKISILKNGYIVLETKNETFKIGNPKDDLKCNFKVNDDSFFTLLATAGLNGAAEAYALGLWKCDDLVKLIQILIRNQNAMNRLDNGLATLIKPINKLIHRQRKNTLTGSKKNILAHYDLSNEFYSLWLDETMTYSCGIFSEKSTTLKEASILKIESLLDNLEISENDTILEIGTGWAGCALHAAKKYKCNVVTTTISDSQYDYAKKKIFDNDLSEKITLLKQDYRNLQGSYDKIISIEMIEAVGHQNIPYYFKKISDLLTEKGLFSLQGITYNDQKFDTYKNSVDFINKYIFPGACLISLSQVTEVCKKYTNLILTDLKDITPHYATTLNIWRKNFLSKREEIKNLGFSENFIRLWEFYLVYCEAGFLERNIGDYQFLFTKKEGLLQK